MRKIEFYQFKKISTAIVLPIILLFILGTLLIAWIVVEANQVAISNGLNELRKSSVSLVVNELDNNLNQAIRINDIHQKAFLRRLLDFSDPKQREQYFVSVLESYPEVLMSYIGFPDGQFYGARRIVDGSIQVVMNNESTGGSSMYYTVDEKGRAKDFYEKFDNFDPRKRPWYQSAVEKGVNAFTPIYNHFIFKEPTVTASIPIYENGELMAVFGVDYLMSWLGTTLSELPIGDKGQVVILNQKDELVSSTIGEPIFLAKEGAMVNRTIAESTNPIEMAINEINGDLGDGEFAREKIGNSNYYIAMDHYLENGLDWRIFTIICEKDFMKHLEVIYYRTFFIILFFIGIFAAFVLYITRIVVKPILKLDKATRNLQEGYFEVEGAEKRKDEIGRLISSFNSMGSNLTSVVNNLEKLVHERTEELERKNEQLSSMSYMDALSGIGNRRKYNEYTNVAIKLAARSKRPVAILLMDIDLFKNFNDTYGHVEGDHCITRVGELLLNIVKRQTDLCARYGGEEFAVVLQETNMEHAKQIAEEIRDGMEKMGIKNKGTPYGILTASVGIYCDIPAEGQTLESVTAKADEALYRAKTQGRNRVVAYESNPSLKET